MVTTAPECEPRPDETVAELLDRLRAGEKVDLRSERLREALRSHAGHTMISRMAKVREH